MTDAKTELRALRRCVKALQLVDQESAARMIAYLHNRFITNPSPALSKAEGR